MNNINILDCITNHEKWNLEYTQAGVLKYDNGRFEKIMKFNNRYKEVFHYLWVASVGEEGIEVMNVSC